MRKMASSLSLSSLRKVAAALLLSHCSHHHAAGHDHRDHHEVHEFTPPKLSFTEGDYFKDLAHGNNIVKSVQQHSDDERGGVEGKNREVQWTIFQGAPSPAAKEAIRRRSGPLLTLFPDADDDNGESVIAAGNSRRARHAVLAPEDQRAYLGEHGKACYRPSAADEEILERYDRFVKSSTLSNLAIELWKYCALYVEGGVYVDDETAPLAALGDARAGAAGGGGSGRKNYAVAAAARDAGVSPSLLNGDDSSISDAVTTASSLGTGNPVAISSVIAIASKEHSAPKAMIETLMTTEIWRLEEDALLLPRTLMGLIEEENAKRKKEGKSKKWGLLKQRCNGIEIASGDGSSSDDEHHRTLRHCPTSAGYCCEILDPKSSFVFLLSRQSLVPNQILPAASALPQPYNSGAGSSSSHAAGAASSDHELAFLSTVREDSASPMLSSSSEPFSPGSADATPNAYELLTSINSLPNQESSKCMDCLREKKAADCTLCAEKCPNFCSHICEIKVNEKPVKRVLSVVGPRYRKDPERLIPRIVHQTWFEPVTPEKYPNMSRLIESWKRSGWEYHFWDDASSQKFLSLHFPPEVREAYDSILPGAFKADLFRYCVLLIRGGIYADMDVMLESNLDAAVPPDVGFMVPVDAPGTKPDKRMCLWNGFIASAPAHPYLSRAIEHVVNNIRNRFTVVDYDQMMCPGPELSVVHAFSTLFTAGPCILGLTVNEVMGRELQQTFVEGDLEKPEGGTVVGVPGRTIILQQNKWDMGAHRFTWVENNLVVAATDMPDYDDRKDLEGEDEDQATHYSKTMDRISIYGEGKVYVDRDIAHEKIVMKTQQAGSASPSTTK